MKRIVQPELLDSLPPADPRAVHSRRDLCRVNSWMRSHVIMAETLQQALDGQPPRQITELGAGDGISLLRTARKIAPHWPGVNAVLVDRQNQVAPQTLAAFASLNWRAETVVTDVFDWPQTNSDVVLTNLFLHHFDEPRLVELLRLISCRTGLFIALEPRRSLWPLLCCRLLWVIGCNDVTRHDAPISVRAGFSGSELSRLWPDRRGWQFTEQGVGAFSHLFIARKIS